MKDVTLLSPFQYLLSGYTEMETNDRPVWHRLEYKIHLQPPPSRKNVLYLHKTPYFDDVELQQNKNAQKTTEVRQQIVPCAGMYVL